VAVSVYGFIILVFTILTFILIYIQNSFSVDRALARALGTLTLLHDLRRRSPRGDRGRLVGEAV
jgi:hypothetical protein